MRDYISDNLKERETEAEQDETYWTIQAMRTFGGSFVQALGEAASRADSTNLQRIKTAWPEYWKEYTEHGKYLKQKENA